MPKGKKASPAKKAKRPYTKRSPAAWIKDVVTTVDPIPTTKLNAKHSSALLKRKKDNADAMYNVLTELRRVVFVEGGEVELMNVALDALRVLRTINNDSLQYLFISKSKGGKQ